MALSDEDLIAMMKNAITLHDVTEVKFLVGRGVDPYALVETPRGKMSWVEYAIFIRDATVFGKSDADMIVSYLQSIQKGPMTKRAIARGHMQGERANAERAKRLGEMLGFDVDEMAHIAIANTKFRNIVRWTPDHVTQLVTYYLVPGEGIPPEEHDDARQFVGVVKGKMRVTLWQGEEGHWKNEHDLEAGEMFMIPEKTIHLVENVGETPLHFWSAYNHDSVQV